MAPSCTHLFSQFEEDVSSLQAFSASNTVEACVRCLKLINPEFQSPKALPEAMSSRYRMCTNLANTVQVSTAVTSKTFEGFLAFSSTRLWDTPGR